MRKWTFCLIAVLSLVGASCSPVDEVERSYDDIVMHPPPGPAEMPLQVKGIPVEDGYLPGQTVEIKLQFINRGPETITISRFPPEMDLISREWKRVDSFESGSEEIQLKPGNTKTYNLVWNQRDENNRQVSPGLYRVDVKNILYVRGDPQRMTRASFSTEWFNILYPQGAIEKTVELNSSQTTANVTIILEKVELSMKGSIFRCFAVQPEDLIIGPNPDAYAEYSFDGITRDADIGGWGTGDNGYRLVWGSEELPLDPIPNGTREVIFTITRLNNIKGPWEFKIPLE